MNSKITEILNNENDFINRKTPKELRELKFNLENYYNTKLTEFKNIFNDKCEEDFHQLKNFLHPVIEEVSLQLTSSFFNSLKNIVQTKIDNTIIFPKNIPELLIEQNIPNLTKGKEYKLYYNEKPYKIIAVDSEKITLPGLSVLKQRLHDEENGKIKKEIKESTNISAFYEPNSMEIKLDDNVMQYKKSSHIGGLRGFLPHRNTYTDIYYNKMYIVLSKDFEFNILEGNNLNFDKKSYNSLVININHSNTLNRIHVGQFGSTLIKKISVKPKLVK